MSYLSNSTTGKIIGYWNRKLRNEPYRVRFLATKILEIGSFKINGKRYGNNQNYVEFPEPYTNSVPKTPSISIVIPAYIKSYSDKNNLINLFKSIRNQTIEPEHVIIVDDCSPLAFECPDSFICRKIEHNSGPAIARNLGKRSAIDLGADIIAFTDSDCVLSEEWLETILAAFIGNSKYQVLSGNTVSNDCHWLGEYHNINGTLNGRKIKGSERLLYGTTANLAITRSVAMKLDFNENFPLAACEDIEFCFKANKNGYSIGFAPQMLVKHNYGYSMNVIHSTIRFVKLFRKYGLGESYLLKEIPDYYAYFTKSVEISDVRYSN